MIISENKVNNIIYTSWFSDVLGETDRYKEFIYIYIWFWILSDGDCKLVQSMSGQLKSPTITVGSLCENKECAMSVSLSVRAGEAVILDRGLQTAIIRKRETISIHTISGRYTRSSKTTVLVSAMKSDSKLD